MERTSFRVRNAGRMRKGGAMPALCALLALAMLLLAACGGSGTAQTSTEAATQADAATTAAAAASEDEPAAEAATTAAATTAAANAGSGGGGAGGASGDKWLQVTQSEDANTLDSQKTTAYYVVPLNIYDRLVECVTVDGKPELVPGLAERWDVSEDGLVYTFHLVKGVKFHNGEELKADDVLYTIERMMDPENETVNTLFFDMIEGALDMFEGRADHVSGVKCLDDYTVEITLAYPFGAFIANLATPPGSIYNRKATEEAGDEFGIDPVKTVGTGPFMATEWILNDRLVLTTNPDYFKGASPLDGVVIHIIPDEDTQRMEFENGNIDVFDVSQAQSQFEYFQTSDQWKDNIASTWEAGLYFYVFNVQAAPFDDVNIRKAIAHAIDRQLILETLYNGEGQVTDTMVVEGVLGHNPDFPALTYDVELAKKLVEESKYGQDLPVHAQIIMTNDASEGETNLNVVLQDMLKDIGIELELVSVDDATYYATRADGTLPMERNAWWVDYNDPDNFLYTYYSEYKTQVYSINYMNQTVFDLLENGRREVNQEKRLKMYQEAEEIIIAEDQVMIPLVQLIHNFVLQDRVQNFIPSWNGWTDMSYYGIDIAG